MIDLKNIVLTFPDGDSRVTAVNNVSLTVPNGKVAGITGPSGSGKSSLLAVAAKLITPDSGEVMINGISTNGMTQKEATALRHTQIGIVFQQANLIPSLTATEQVFATLATENKASKAVKAEWRSKALELLDAVGLADYAHKRPHQLSGGQKQRVNIARAMMGEPSVLIVDEPTSALDQERGREIIGLIMELTAQYNTATMCVTHDQSHLPFMDAVYTMIDGSFTQS